jgi:archaellum component FlaC
MWLDRLGLVEQYGQTFREHEIDGQTLCELGASAWEALGVTKLGHQSVLRRAIADAVARDTAREAHVHTPGDGTMVDVDRDAADIGRIHDRMNDICSALSAASERVEALEVELEMKQTMVATSQAAAERRVELAFQTSAVSLSQVIEQQRLNTDQIAKMAAVVSQLSTALDAANVKIEHNEILSRTRDSNRRRTPSSAFDVRAVRSWTVEQVTMWLDRLGLVEQYGQTFREHEIDGQTLCELGASAWEALGVTKLGHQSVLRRAIADAVARDTAREAHVHTPGDGTMVDVDRDAADIGRIHDRMNDICSALSAASERVEALEVELEMKQTMVATSQAAAERRVESVETMLSALSEEHASRAVSLQNAIQAIEVRQNRLIELTLRAHEQQSRAHVETASDQIQPKAAIELMMIAGTQTVCERGLSLITN